jgi:hypothetical protein
VLGARSNQICIAVVQKGFVSAKAIGAAYQHGGLCQRRDGSQGGTDKGPGQHSFLKAGNSVLAGAWGGRADSGGMEVGEQWNVGPDRFEIPNSSQSSWKNGVIASVREMVRD